MTFYETVTAAVADLTAHGFDSQERVELWLERLRAAAEKSFVSKRKMEDMLRRSLRGIYERMVENGGAIRYHGGVSAFTLQNVKPKLHDELQRRIMASSDLITLNREQSVAKTMQRFQGWASSVPAGGSRVQPKAAVKYDIGKSLKQLPFEERRVIIDQGHKLTASINDVIAMDGGAIALRWHSHWREQNYNFRKDHKERDGKVYLIRNSWAHKKGFVKPGPAGYSDEITAPAEEPFCFPGETLIPFADGVEAAFRRWYSGPIATIITASGRMLSGTPNHPILTPHGWVAIGALKEGDDVIEMAEQVVQLSEQDQHGAETSIADAFAAVGKVGSPQKRGGQMQQFHGDGAGGDVDIVVTDRPLSFGAHTSGAHGIDQLGFTMAYGGGAVGGSLDLTRDALHPAAHGAMRRAGEASPALGSLALHPDGIGGRPASGFLAQEAQMAADPTGGEAKPSGDRLRAFASDVGFDHSGVVSDQSPLVREACDQPSIAQPLAESEGVDAHFVRDLRDSVPFRTQAQRVVNVDTEHRATHVFNLQTTGGHYVAGGIVSHNCRCFASYLYSVRRLPDDMVTEKGRAAMAAAKAKASA